MSVKFVQFFCGNPQFLMIPRPRCLHRAASDILVCNQKFCDISLIAGRLVPCIPALRNFRSIFLIQYRIKDWLLRQARRKCPVSAFSNQIQFRLSDRPIPYHFHHLNLFLSKCARLTNVADALCAHFSPMRRQYRFCPRLPLFRICENLSQQMRRNLLVVHPQPVSHH